MRPLGEASQELRHELARHALDADDVDSIFRSDSFARSHELGEESNAQLRELAKSILVDNAEPDDRRLFRRLVQLLDSAVDLGLSNRLALNPFPRVFGCLRVAVGSSLAILALYIVLGGLHETYPRSWLFRVAGFCLLLALLAVYEGLQISIVLLRLKDLHSLRERLPRAYALHPLFRHEEGTRRFLAGRQFFVVVVVFLVARLTSVPTPDNLPWLGIAMPHWLMSSVGFVCWDLGIAAALLTLWIGQLAPQFIANRLPARFLQFPGMGLALKAAILLDDLGVTAPGTWLATAVARSQDCVPPSAREAYREYIESYGFAVLGIKKHWAVSRSSASLKYQTAAIVRQRGLGEVTDDMLIVHGSSIRPSFSGYVIGVDGAQREIRYTTSSPDREGDVTQFRETVTPQLVLLCQLC